MPDADPFLPRKTLWGPAILYNGALDPQAASNVVVSFEATRQTIASRFRLLMDQGYIASLAEFNHLVESTMAYSRDDDVPRRFRFLAAFTVDVSELIFDFIRSRAGRHGGKSNITIEFRGRTGTGKSSAALSVCQLLGMGAGHVAEQVAYLPGVWNHYLQVLFTRREAAQKAQQPGPPPVMMLDEESAGVGEGSQTQQKLIRSQEGKLREAGISMVFCRPNAKDPMTRDLTFEMMGVNPKTRETWGIAFLDDTPQGYVRFPWVPEPFWMEYQKIKTASLFGSAKHFNADRAVMRSHIVEVVLDRGRMSRMARGQFKPAFVRLEIDDHLSLQYSASQVDGIADAISTIGKHWGPNGNPQLFGQMVLDLLSRGVFWGPDATTIQALRTAAEEESHG